MPRSKHRRKPGGKSVRHPGRSHSGSTLAKTADEVRWDRYDRAIRIPFHQQSHPECDYADEMLHAVTEAVYDPYTPQFRPVAKDPLFATFMQPYEKDDGTRIIRTPEQAEAALRYLVKRELIVVDGDTVSFHPRFADLLDLSKLLPMMRAEADLTSSAP
jgi:hypothetical protein